MFEMLAIAMVGYAVIVMLLIVRRNRRNFGLKRYETRSLPEAASPINFPSPIGLSDGY